MKFLIKLEDAINKWLTTSFEKLKASPPRFILSIAQFFKSLPLLFKKKLANRFRVFYLKTIGYTEHYGELFRDRIALSKDYLKSGKWKEIDYKAFLSTLSFSPKKLLAISAVSFFAIFTTFYITKNVTTIIKGTAQLRAPASSEDELPSVSFSHLSFKTMKGEEFSLTVKLIVEREKEIKELEKIRDQIQTHLKGTQFSIAKLPIGHMDIDKMEKAFLESVGGQKIVDVKIEQELKGRPEYFLQSEKQITIRDIHLQLFIEDTHRNRQLFLNFTVLASNRNIVLFLREHEIALKDHLNLYVEPVIPLFPIEEEGKLIIKEKIKDEVELFLQKNKIQGTVEEIYIDYMLVS